MTDAARRLSITDGIRAAALARPHRVALRVGNECLTYTALVDRMDRVTAAALTGLRLRRGDRVAVLLPNCLPYLEIVCGCAAAGMPVAQLPPMATAREIETIIADCGAKILFCHASNEEAARGGAGHLVERIIVTGADYDDWLANARPLSDPPPIDESDIFSIPYTSGSTGKPKGVMLSHRSRVLTAYAMAAEYREMGPDSRMLVTTPVFHGAGFVNMLAPCWFGGEAIIMPRFSITELLATAARHRVTKVHMIPAHFAAYFQLPAAERGRYDLSSLRCIVSGTAPLSQAMKERIIETFGPGKLHERYGSTETSVVTNLRPEDQLRKQASVGNTFAGARFQIRDAAGAVLPPGEIGELWCRSSYMFSGYWNRPAEQAQAVRDGWVSVGDLARRDDEGYLYLIDRKNDMIISGGENIYPREIEEILHTHPGVVEAAVVGIPHPYWGEAVTAFIHLREGAHASPEDLLALCRQHLARWKVPKRVVIGPRLPRNSLGKILRRDLRQQDGSA